VRQRPAAAREQAAESAGMSTRDERVRQRPAAGMSVKDERVRQRQTIGNRKRAKRWMRES
jgi:hypothetical protein